MLLEAVDDKYPELVGSPAPHAVAVNAISASAVREAATTPCSTCCSITTEAWLAALDVDFDPTTFGVNPAHLEDTDFSDAVCEASVLC